MMFIKEIPGIKCQVLFNSKKDSCALEISRVNSTDQNARLGVFAASLLFTPSWFLLDLWHPARKLFSNNSMLAARSVSRHPSSNCMQLYEYSGRVGLASGMEKCDAPT
jgi:hypothetical protein